jgi:hypothetical protein
VRLGWGNAGEILDGLLGAHALDVEPGDWSEVVAGADSEFLDDDGDDLSGMPRAELDDLAVDHEAAA